jgi:hypothetical protein
MAEYLVAFNQEWIPDLTGEDLREASKRVSALRTPNTLRCCGGVAGR